MGSLRVYSTTGVRPECDFFLWKITERYEDLGELGAALNGTPLAGWLTTPYSYLATTKASEYTKASKPRQVVPKGSPYLVVYPSEAASWRCRRRISGPWMIHARRTRVLDDPQPHRRTCSGRPGVHDGLSARSRATSCNWR
jgi:hypothetical protein